VQSLTGQSRYRDPLDPITRSQKFYAGSAGI